MPVCRVLDFENQPVYAVYQDGKYCPLSELTDDVPVGMELLDRGTQWLSALPVPSKGQWRAAPRRLPTPLPHPEKIICIGLNYRDHAIETGATIPTEPVVFSKFATALIGDGAEIKLPRVAHEVDYEAELVVVIGKTAKYVSASEAMQHVFGYTCGHDVSARDWQRGRPGGQWLLGKTFDTFAPVGPCVATVADIPDPTNLGVRMRLNDQLVQNSSSDQLIFDIPTLIAHLSQIMTLHPGDLLFTGTPPGVGVARTPPVFLKPGDRCSVEIDGIGTLTNQCVADEPS